MDKQTILKNIATALKANFPKLAEEVKVLMNAVPAPAPVPTPILAQDKKTQDGKTLSVEGEFIVGAPIMEVGADGTKAPVADGSYILEDGSTVAVTGGLITALTPKVEQAAPPAPAQFEAQLSKQKTELEKYIETKLAAEKDVLIKKIEALEVSNKTLVQFADAVLNTPVPDLTPNPVKFEKQLTDEEYNKLTNYEKVQYNRLFKK
jgi:hypothetical protein